MSIELKNLNLVKNSKVILENINFNFEAGKVYGLLGSNGAGKTSLFRSMLGLVPYQGNIVINGKSYNFKDEKDYLQEFGMVMPFPEKLENLKVKEIVDELSAYVKNFSQRRFSEMLNKLNLDISLDEKVKNLSLGMKQKLNIALAISHQPKILILDEVFNGLDRDTIEIAKKIISKEKERGTLVVVSSHSFSELENLIDVSIVMNKGRIIGSKSVEKLENKNLGEFYNLVLKGEMYE